MKTKIQEVNSLLTSLVISGVYSNRPALFWYNEAKDSYANMQLWHEYNNGEMFDIAYDNALFSAQKAKSFCNDFRN